MSPKFFDFLERVSSLGASIHKNGHTGTLDNAYITHLDCKRTSRSTSPLINVSQARIVSAFLLSLVDVIVLQ